MTGVKYRWPVQVVSVDRRDYIRLEVPKGTRISCLTKKPDVTGRRQSPASATLLGSTAHPWTPSCGLGYTGKRAESEGLLDPYTQYLGSLDVLVPGARFKQAKKESAWNVAAQDGRIIRVDALLADKSRGMGGFMQSRSSRRS